MKKVLLSVVTGLVAFSAQAQLTITQADFASVNDKVVLATDTVAPGLTLGATGSGQVWNFTALSADEMDSLMFIDPASLPEAADYPTANISFMQMGANAYVEKSANGVEVLGLAGQLEGAPFAVNAPMNPTQTIMVFPASLGTSFNDTSQIDVVIDITAVAQGFADSARLKRTYYHQHSVDAEGQLTLDIGSWAALRDKVDETMIDSMWIYASTANPIFGIEQGWQIVPDAVAAFIGLDGGITTSQDRFYRFYGANSKFFYAEINVNPQTDAVESARYQSNVNELSVPESVYNSKAVSVFPNPATDNINVLVKDIKGAVTFTMFDATGRQVSSAQLTGTQNNVNVSGLTSGLYMFRATNSKGELVKTGKLTIK